VKVVKSANVISSSSNLDSYLPRCKLANNFLSFGSNPDSEITTELVLLISCSENFAVSFSVLLLFVLDVISLSSSYSEKYSSLFPSSVFSSTSSGRDSGVCVLGVLSIG